jgi:hypothetical protein
LGEMREEREDGGVKGGFHLLWPHGLLPGDTDQTGDPPWSSQWSLIGSTDLGSVKPRIWIILIEKLYR